MYVNVPQSRSTAAPPNSHSGSDYVPVYYLACTDATLYNTGIYMLGFGAIVPAAIVAWVFIYVKRYYRPAIWFGWSFIVVGVALLSIAKDGESPAHVVRVSGLIGAGLG